MPLVDHGESRNSGINLLQMTIEITMTCDIADIYANCHLLARTLLDGRTIFPYRQQKITLTKGRMMYVRRVIMNYDQSKWISTAVVSLHLGFYRALILPKLFSPVVSGVTR